MSSLQMFADKKEEVAKLSPLFFFSPCSRFVICR